MVVSRLQFAFVNRLWAELVEDTILAPLIACLSTILDSHGPCLWRDALLWYKGQLVVPASNELWTLIFQEFYATSKGGHSRFEKNYFHLSSSFYWKGLQKDVKSFVDVCDVWQHYKFSTLSPSGLFQLVLIPSVMWVDISMNFVEGLPTVAITPLSWWWSIVWANSAISFPLLTPL